MNKPRVLVTGGLGFVGSHVAVALAQANFEPILLDNLIHSHKEVVSALQQVVGSHAITFVRGSSADASLLQQLFERYAMVAVIHCAGIKAVAESVQQPQRYYQANLSSMLPLLGVMQQHNCRVFLLSSSATVYGSDHPSPLHENLACRPQNPYGRSKWFMEEILRDIARSNRHWRSIGLRYFNPLGGHESGHLGEDPPTPSQNLLPSMVEVGLGRRPELRLFGGDYPTEDGTAIRDYVHVMDVAEGHVAALRFALDQPGFFAVNLGRGCGTSVMQLVNTFIKTNRCPLPYRLSPRRPGDSPAYWADVDLAAKLFGFRAQRDLASMCQDAWRFWQHNPQGYLSKRLNWQKISA